MDEDNGTLRGFRELLKKLQKDKSEASQADAIDPVVTSSDTAKGYAHGGMADMSGNDFMTAMKEGIPGMTDKPAPNPPLSAVASSLNNVPDTNYDFYKGVGPEERMALYQKLQAQKQGPGGMIAQGLGGIGDAISNSFGGQKNTFQKDILGQQDKRMGQELEAFDTQRAQKREGMQANQEAMMNDPNHPLSKGMRAILKSRGVNVPSGMNANVLLKALGPLGELAYKDAMLGFQKSKEASETADKSSGRKLEAAKGLQSRPWYQRAMEAVTGDRPETAAMRSELGTPATPAPQAAAPEAAHGVPDLGSTFNGGKVLRVKRIK